jgi:outer membrane biosynthesis protein TonB
VPLEDWFCGKCSRARATTVHRPAVQSSCEPSQRRQREATTLDYKDRAAKMKEESESDVSSDDSSDDAKPVKAPKEKVPKEKVPKEKKAPKEKVPKEKKADDSDSDSSVKAPKEKKVKKVKVTEEGSDSDSLVPPAVVASKTDGAEPAKTNGKENVAKTEGKGRGIVQQQQAGGSSSSGSSSDGSSSRYAPPDAYTESRVEHGELCTHAACHFGCPPQQQL